MLPINPLANIRKQHKKTMEKSIGFLILYGILETDLK